jgi:hypothetical protein
MAGQGSVLRGGLGRRLVIEDEYVDDQWSCEYRPDDHDHQKLQAGVRA